MTYLVPVLVLVVLVLVVAARLTHSTTIILAAGLVAFLQGTDLLFGPILINDDRRKPGVRERVIRYAAPLAAVAAWLLTHSVWVATLIWALVFALPAVTAPLKSSVPEPAAPAAPSESGTAAAVSPDASDDDRPTIPDWSVLLIWTLILIPIAWFRGLWLAYLFQAILFVTILWGTYDLFSAKERSYLRTLDSVERLWKIGVELYLVPLLGWVVIVPLGWGWWGVLVPLLLSLVLFALFALGAALEGIWSRFKRSDKSK